MWTCEHGCHDGERICGPDPDRCCGRPGISRKELEEGASFEELGPLNSVEPWVPDE